MICAGIFRVILVQGIRIPSLVSLDEDDEILAAWVEEAERRGDAYERGEMGAVDFDESIVRLKAELASAA